MAQSFEIKGATTILTDSVLAATFVALGITDHDDTVAVEVTNHEHLIHTNESGPDMPEKVLNLGLTGKVIMNLVRWDKAQLTSLIETTTASAGEGEIGILGADKKVFALKVVGTTVGSEEFLFPFCRIVEPWRLTEWGSKDSRTSLSIECFPNPAALATATTTLYTKATVS